MISPTVADLRCLEAAVRTGSISRAAKELGLTQQAVSYRLRALERLIGMELLQRSHTGITPTATGTAVLDAARRVLAEMHSLESVIASAQGQSRETLTVAASQTIASHLLPDWILELRRTQTRHGRSATAVQLHTANSTDVAAMVRAGSVDLGFIETPNPPAGLGAATVGHDEMVLAVAADHPLAERSAIAIAEAAELALVTREAGSGTRAAFEAAVAQRLGTTARDPAVVLATEAAVRSAVAAGVAPAVLSELTIRDDVHLGRIRPLSFTPDRVTRPLTAIWRGTDRDLTGVSRELVSLASR